MFLNGLQKKTSAVFEVAEVVPVMTNNYEESILKGARVGMNDYIFSLCFNRPAQLQWLIFHGSALDCITV